MTLSPQDLERERLAKIMDASAAYCAADPSGDYFATDADYRAIAALLREPRQQTDNGIPEVVSVVAAVRHRDGKFWVCRRNGDGAHGGLAGMWEYPGGKVEQGESLADALRREMREEFDVDVNVGPWLDTIEGTHADKPGKVYAVHFMACEFLNDPTLRCHDDAAWLTIAELEQQEHLPSGTAFNARLTRLAPLLSGKLSGGEPR